MYKLKTKWFSKWAKKQKLVDNKLLIAIENNIFVEIGE